ncbi:type II toxin-antitoxin system VapC family toxin [Leucothrix pacifica]|uniref:VapC toxin family PIN domain ribonuclease n=1 Tax=Leucothrix pacifica TaxID=1247513 RepID=A0A317C954_9GAMM|nr:type II toxin-antitoxin system VapC family toxin [Leucothrix pacifica]PWQ95086.1 VapC toxin family PIN domain ribonuclease [Leucothrix pacifica]
MRVLLDTCVLSELQKPHCTESVREFVRRLPEKDVFVSAISIGEIAKGIALLDEGSRKRGLLQWLNGLVHNYEENIVSVDKEVSQIWGEITAKAQRRGMQIPAGDGLIAACALHQGLHIVTRNVKDFEPTGALIINPWVDD